MSNVNKEIKNLATAKHEEILGIIEETGRRHFDKLLGDFFKSHPKIRSVSFHATDNYFNDGEETPYKITTNYPTVFVDNNGEIREAESNSKEYERSVIFFSAFSIRFYTALYGMNVEMVFYPDKEAKVVEFEGEF